MNSRATRRIDRANCERLLRDAATGQLGTGTHGDALLDSVAKVLAAAAAPAHADELAGEQATLAAFRANVAAPRGRPAKPSRTVNTLARLLTLKVGAILVATTLGGVALAASTGVLPQLPNPLNKSPDLRSSAAPAETRTENPGPRPSAGATAEPSLGGLCQAYSAGAKNDHGKSLDNPAFGVLITTAGGRDKVDGYCAQLLSPTPGHSPDHPTGRPSKSDTDHPTGAPADGRTTGNSNGNGNGNSGNGGKKVPAAGQ